MKQMNKTEFICALEKKLNYPHDKCIIINSIVEDTFILSKKSKDIMISKFIDVLNVSEDEANHIYEIVQETIKTGITDRLRHPFGNIKKGA